MDKYTIKIPAFCERLLRAKEFINRFIIMQLYVILELGFLQEGKLFSFSTDFHRPEVFLTATKHRIHAEL